MIPVEPGLGVQDVDAGRSAMHEQEDDLFGSRLEVRLPDGQRVGLCGGGGKPVRLGQEAGQAQHAEAAGRVSQHGAAGQQRGTLQLFPWILDHEITSSTVQSLAESDPGSGSQTRIAWFLLSRSCPRNPI